MKTLAAVLISTISCYRALALVDSYRDFPTKIANWSFTSTHMDKGELRGCAAKGKFGDLNISLGSPSSVGFKTTEISFKFTRGGAGPSAANPGDQRACGAGNDHAPRGSWRHSAKNSNEEFCDGKSWTKITEGNFKRAALMLDENEVATTKDNGYFKVGSISGKPIYFQYAAWFQQVEGLEKKLSRPGKATLRIDGLSFGPIALGDLRFDKAFAELARCERERK